MADDKAQLQVLTEIRNALRGFDRLEQEFKDATAAMDAAAAQVDFDPTSESAKELQEDVQRAARAIVKETRAAARANKELETAQRQVNGELDRLGRDGVKNVSGLRNAVHGLAAAFAAVQLKRFFESAVQASLELDKVQNTLRAATGSTAEAAEEFKFISDESDRLGLSLEGTASSYAKLLAATKGTALEGEKTKDIFRAVAEATTVLGLSAADAEGAFLAITQIVSKGTVSLEELNSQLGERLPGVLRIAAEATGRTTEELIKLVSQGKITAEELLPPLAAGLKNAFGPGLEAAINGRQANLNRLNNELLLLKASFAGGFADEFNKALSDSAGSAKELRESAAALGSTVGFLITGFQNLANVLVGSLGVALAGALEIAHKVNDGFLALAEGAARFIPGLDNVADAIERAREKAKEAQEVITDFGISSFEDAKRGVIAFGEQLGIVETQSTKAAEAVVKVGEAATQAGEEFAGTIDGEQIPKFRGELDETATSAENLAGKLSDAAAAARDVAAARTAAKQAADASKAAEKVGDLQEEYDGLNSQLVVTEEQAQQLQEKSRDLQQAQIDLRESSNEAAEGMTVFGAGSEEAAAAVNDQVAALVRADQILQQSAGSLGLTKDQVEQLNKNVRENVDNVDEWGEGLNLAGIEITKAGEASDKNAKALDNLRQKVGGSTEDYGLLAQILADTTSTQDGLSDATGKASERQKDAADSTKELREEVKMLREELSKLKEEEVAQLAEGIGLLTTKTKEWLEEFKKVKECAAELPELI